MGTLKTEPHAQVYAFARGADLYFQRKRKGIEAADVCSEGEEDFETTARDAVSDVLTALFGPSGWYEAGGLASRSEAREEAMDFLDKCYASWTGDAEDYELPPLDAEPGRRYAFETVHEAVAQFTAANRAVTSVSSPAVWEEVREPILAEMLKLCTPEVRVAVAERYGAT